MRRALRWLKAPVQKSDPQASEHPWRAGRLADSYLLEPVFSTTPIINALSSLFLAMVVRGPVSGSKEQSNGNLLLNTILFFTVFLLFSIPLIAVAIPVSLMALCFTAVSWLSSRLKSAIRPTPGSSSDGSISQLYKELLDDQPDC